MALGRFQLLALDIDGTLVNSRDEISQPTLQALREARQAGIRVVLVTGRRYRRTLHLAEQLELDAPVITASGALIKQPHNHRTLHCAELARPTLLETLRVVEGAGYQAVMYADSYHEGFDFYCVHATPDQMELAEYLRLNAGFERVVPQLMREPPPAIFAGFAMGRQAEMHHLADELQRCVPGALYTHVIRSPAYSGYMCEISRAGSTKWSALKMLADDWHIPAAAICAVGDDVNDIPMIEAAGLGVAMGNAVDEVKQIADRVAPSQEEDGVREVVRWLLQSS